MKKSAQLMWYVRGYHGGELVLATCLSGRISCKQIHTLLQRLACRHLSPQQLIDCVAKTSDLRPTAYDRSSMRFEVGEGRHTYVAERVSRFQLNEMQATQAHYRAAA